MLQHLRAREVRRLRDVILQTCRAVCGYVARPLRAPPSRSATAKLKV